MCKCGEFLHTMFASLISTPRNNVCILKHFKSEQSYEASKTQQWAVKTSIFSAQVIEKTISALPHKLQEDSNSRRWFMK